MQLIWLVLTIVLSVLSGAAMIACSVYSPLSLTLKQRNRGFLISVVIFVILMGRVPDPYGIVVFLSWLAATFITERILLPGPGNARYRFYR